MTYDEVYDVITAHLPRERSKFADKWSRFPSETVSVGLARDLKKKAEAYRRLGTGTEEAARDCEAAARELLERMSLEGFASPIIQYGVPGDPTTWQGLGESPQWFKVHWVAGSYAGVRKVQAEDGEEAKAKVRAWVRKQMAIPQYYESYRVEELDGLEASPRGSDELPADALFVEMLGPHEKWMDNDRTFYLVNPSTRKIINVARDTRRKRYQRPPRVGTRVRFAPNPASLQLYSDPPAEGEEGEVTTVAGPRGQMSFMRGPGGGLVYVDWDDHGPMGVSLLDIERA
jgi:hypothetical protein